MRKLTARAASMLGVAVWASAASAAGQSAATSKIVPLASFPTEHAILMANFGLGGGMAPSLGQDYSALRSGGNGAAQALQFDLGYGRNWEPSGELFPSAAAVNSGFLSGTHAFARATVALGRDVSFEASHLNLGAAALSEAKPSAFSRELAARLGANAFNAATTTARLNWNFSSWGGVAVSGTTSRGDTALLGASALRNARATESSALGISARVGFGEGWVTSVTYAEGVSQLDLSGRGVAVVTDPVRSEAFGIGFAKTGLFGDDALGLALTRPLQIYTAQNSFGALNTNFPLATTHAQESDLALGYVTTFLDGTLALQANAAYQVNAAGARGQNAVAGVARARLNF